MLHSTLRVSLAAAVAAALVGCEADPADEPSACFDVPRLAGGWDANGVSLQGREAPRRPSASPDAPRRAGMETQGGYLGLSDLDGVRLSVVETGARVRLEAGRPVADGFFAETLIGVDLLATTRDLRSFVVRLGRSDLDPRGTPRIEVVVDGQPVCETDDHGVFVAGRWDDHATHIDVPGALTYACGSGVIAKCAAWGWAPWLTDAGVHQACTRMARADYCGDGTPWTVDGTVIDAYDAIGIQSSLEDRSLRFEAAWGPDGAVCVGRTRYAIVDAAGDTIVPSCLTELPTCDSLEDAAAAHALLANDSRPQTLETCE